MKGPGHVCITSPTVPSAGLNIPAPSVGRVVSGQLRQKSSTRPHPPSAERQEILHTPQHCPHITVKASGKSQVNNLRCIMYKMAFLPAT